MKIIHCSDLHLDSPMGTHLSVNQARERNAELCHNFARLIDYALAENVRAVLIAGDLFDGNRVTVRTGTYILDQIRRAPKILFFYLKGNHDEYSQAFLGEVLPSNLKLFDSRWKYWKLASDEGPDLVITGIEPDDWIAPFYDNLKLSGEHYNIVMMHGQAATSPGQDCICLPALARHPVSYLALGHIHSFVQEPLGTSGCYCYCGCLEGRGFDECGDKGFVLIETDKQGIRSYFVPWAKRRLWSLSVDISDCPGITSQRQAMEEACAKIQPQDLVRFELTGLCGLETQKDLTFLKQGFSDRFYYAEIIDHTRLALEEKDYQYDISLKGAFLRSVMKEDYPAEDKDLIIELGLKALKGEDLP